MKKSLIAVAVASAFIAPAAMADVTISGAINVAIQVGKSSAGSAPGAQSLTTNQLGAQYSHVDIESVDDIGGGNKVIFHYQMNLAGDSPGAMGNTGGITNRNSFLGVAGGWGAFKMGVNENVYERMMYTADPLDGAAGPAGNLNILGTPGGGFIFENNVNNCTATGCPDFYRRTQHTIWYESPKFAGFDFEVDYTLSAFKNQNQNPQIFSIGGKWQPEGAPFYIDLAYERHNDLFGTVAIGDVVGPTSTSKDTGVQVGGGWQLGDLGLHLRYEQLKYETTGGLGGDNEYKRNAYWFAVKYNLPSGYIGAEIGIAEDGKLNGSDVSDTGARMFGIGYFHNLSKQSQLQFIYGRMDNKDQATYGFAGTPNGNAPGSDHDVLSVGLKHTF